MVAIIPTLGKKTGKKNLIAFAIWFFFSNFATK